MSAYLALEPGWLLHSKVRKVHKDARLLWLAGALHCVALETDGLIEKHMLPILAAHADVAPKRAGELVAAGLWRDIGDSYEVHDFLKYNQSKATRELKREKWRRQKDPKAGSTAESGGDSTAEVPENPAGSSGGLLDPTNHALPCFPGSGLEISTTTSTSYPGEVVVVLEAMTESEWADNPTTVTSEDAWKRRVGKRLEGEWATRFVDALNRIPTEGDTTLFELADQVFHEHQYRYKYPVLSRLSSQETVCTRPTPSASSPDFKASGHEANGQPPPSTNGARSSSTTAST